MRTQAQIDEELGFIFGRRSIRVYTPGEVDEETVQKLLAAAMAAPSAVAKDPWRFVVVRNRQQLARLAAALANGEMLDSATLAIAVCGDLAAAHDGQLSYLLQDCAAAIENLLLAAHILGLGSCWMGVHPRKQRIKNLKEILSLPASVIPVACIAIGHPGAQNITQAATDAGLDRQLKANGTLRKTQPDCMLPVCRGLSSGMWRSSAVTWPWM